MSIVYKSRILLVRLAKMFPFVLCAIVCLSYCEILYSVMLERYVTMGDGHFLDCSFSWLIGDYFTYGWHTIIVATILSVAFETCIWNKLSLLYLCANLYEKDCFVDGMDRFAIVIVCLANVIVSSYLVYKGIKTLT